MDSNVKLIEKDLSYTASANKRPVNPLINCI